MGSVTQTELGSVLQEPLIRITIRKYIRATAPKSTTELRMSTLIMALAGVDNWFFLMRTGHWTRSRPRKLFLERQSDGCTTWGRHATRLTHLLY